MLDVGNKMDVDTKYRGIEGESRHRRKLTVDCV